MFFVLENREHLYSLIDAPPLSRHAQRFVKPHLINAESVYHLTFNDLEVVYNQPI